MLIGIDLDNTIINYNFAFQEGLKYLNIKCNETLLTKNEIRDYLRNLENGEYYWQKLQGLVYGKLLNKHSKIFEGIYRFLWRSTLAGNKIIIISHKTEFGHFDKEKISLRKEALTFLKNNTIFFDKYIDQIIFKNTFEDKINEIKRHPFSIFIDDLHEVLSNIPINISKYLFSDGWNNSKIKSRNWLQIDFEINGFWNKNEINMLTLETISKEPKDIIQIMRSGNSAVYKLQFEDNNSLKLKIYSFENDLKRINIEFDSLALLKKEGIHNIPKTVIKNEQLGIALYEWIEGEKITNPSKIDIDECIKFIYKINSLKNKFDSDKNEIHKASAACLSAVDIQIQVEKRLSIFNSPRILNSELNSFLEHEFYPSWIKILDYVKNNWQLNIDFNEVISTKDKILSPSDFGFHNALKDKNGDIYFLDFEYFGWDDPVKLASDFYIHPAMNLNDNLAEYWVNNFFKLFGQNNLKRFQLLKFLYWMNWPLIILNDFRDDVWLRRSLSLNSEGNRKEILSIQLNKSKDLLERINYIFKTELENYAT